LNNNVIDDIKKVIDVNKFSVFKGNRTPSFFKKGRGNIQSDCNKLELSNMIPENNGIIIRYQWMENLKIES